MSRVVGKGFDQRAVVQLDHYILDFISGAKSLNLVENWFFIRVDFIKHTNHKIFGIPGMVRIALGGYILAGFMKHKLVFFEYPGIDTFYRRCPRAQALEGHIRTVGKIVHDFYL